MAANVRRVVKSRSNRRLLTAAESFISTYPEVRAILPGGAATRLASAEIVYRGRGTAGVHRTTLIQFAASLARPAMAKRALVPLSPLGQEAVAARIVHAARQNREIEYFNPVAALPGFSRALARTLGELRLAGVAPEDLESTGASGPDLSRLLSRYRAELEARSLADLSAIFQLAGEAAETSAEAALPLLLLDAPLDTRAHRDFFSRLVARAPAVLAAISSGEHTESILGVEAEDLDAGKSATPIEHLRQYVFSEAPPASATQDGFEMFSAPGEGLEAVEIARRILRMTAEGIRFDQIAILLRNPERYQPVIEEALRRARIPAYFSRGTARPDPAGRAFLALLACASERCSASRFAEYLSIGQVPSLGHGSFEPWVPPADELLMPPEERAQPSDRQPEKTIRTPANWEKLLVDAAVIGGRDRWERRLKGLEREFELRRESLEDDEPQREYLTRQLERLRNLSDFALPLVAVLDALPRSASWGEWLVALANLARMAISNPEGVLAVLAEFEPMAEVGPVALEEAAEVLSERLRFLRTEPPQRRWGRVYVGSVDEARGCEFRVVFLPGLAEGLFPQRVLEDPLLLDQCREQLPGSLPVRADRNKEERQRLNMAIAAARERFIASYPRMDVAQARPRVPSFYAL